MKDRTKHAFTYREWQKRNRHVRKGQHCVGRNDEGVPVFTLGQTQAYKQRYSLGDHPDPWADNGEEEAFFTQIGSYFDDIGDR